MNHFCPAFHCVGFPPRPGRAVTWKGWCMGPGRYPRVPSLALHVHSDPFPSPAGVVMPIGTVCGARQVSSGARSRLACPQVPRYCGIHGCSPVMSLKFGYSYSFLTTRLATPWFFFLQCRGTSVHRQRSKGTLGCLPGPTHLRTKRCNCPCRASATPSRGMKRNGEGWCAWARIWGIRPKQIVKSIDCC